MGNASYYKELADQSYIKKAEKEEREAEATLREMDRVIMAAAKRAEYHADFIMPSCNTILKLHAYGFDTTITPDDRLRVSWGSGFFDS